MDIHLLPAPARADQIPLERLADSPVLTEPQKVAELARQFESLLVQQILAEARKSIHSEGLGESSSTLGIYHDLINRTLADSISRNGMVGLASSLQAQLTRQTADTTPCESEPQP